MAGIEEVSSRSYSLLAVATMAFWLTPIVGGKPAHAFLEGLLEGHRAVMLLQEVRKGFVGQLLEVFHAVPPQQGARMPGVVVELHALARKGGLPRLARRRKISRAPAAAQGPGGQAVPHFMRATA